MTETKTDTPDKASAASGVTSKTETDAEVTNIDGPPEPDPASQHPPKDDKDKEADKSKDTDADKSKETKEETTSEEGDNEADKSDDKDKEADLDTDVWGSTGDDVGDSVLALLQNSGIAVADAKALLFDAVKAGDVSKVDRAALTEKVGKDRATLILAGAENFVSRSKTQAESILKDVHGSVGGEENWKHITTWAKTNVTEQELGEYRALLDAGGARARFAAQELAGKYNADEKNTTLNAGAGEIAPSGKAAASGRAISRAEYYAELSAAHAENAPAAKIKSIQQARERGRAQGK